MKHVVRDDPVVHEESTIYARQQAAPRRIQLGTPVESSLDIALGKCRRKRALMTYISLFLPLFSSVEASLHNVEGSERLNLPLRSERKALRT